MASRIVDQLRLLKIEGKEVPNTLEVVLVPLKQTKAQFPGIFLFSGPARMMRPVLNLFANKIEMIGTFEQVYLDICVSPEEAYKGESLIFDKTRIYVIYMALHEAIMLIRQKPFTALQHA